jgi:hypothetical protein
MISLRINRGNRASFHLEADMRTRKIIRRLVWTLISLATLIALFYAEEDWRGARAWNAVLRQMHDAGEPLTLRDLIPRGASAADLSKTGMFADESPEISNIRLPRGLGDTPKLAALVPLREIDLRAWQKYFRSLPHNHLPAKPGTPAADVLTALSPLDPLVARLENVLAIPNGYLPIDYDTGFGTPIVSSVAEINVAKVLQLRGLAHLQLGQGAQAKDDFLFRFRMEKPLRHRLFLIDLLVSEANQSISLPVLWEGMHDHAWSNADLKQMESALRQHDYLSDFQSALRVERLGAFQVVAALSTQAGISKNQDPNPGVRLFAQVFQIWPTGWIEQDWAALGRMDARAIGGIHPRTGTMDREVFSVHRPDWLQVHMKIFTWEIAPLIYSAATKAAHAETDRRLACVACELERYHLVHHAYPNQLGDLAGLPPHLKQEVLSMAPFHYQNLGPTYRLYSTGWDEKDEDGRYDAPDPIQGDWPWPGP